MPPITDPGKLSKPPITAATKPKTKSTSKEFGERMSLGVTKIPANAPAAPAKTQPIVLIGPTLIPAKRAISGWNAEALNESPKSVFWKINEKMIIIMAAPTITIKFNIENGSG